MKTAILALRSGCDIERIAKALESFASGNMKELGYKSSNKHHTYKIPISD
jgi:hypothetical protein